MAASFAVLDWTAATRFCSIAELRGTGLDGGYALLLNGGELCGIGLDGGYALLFDSDELCGHCDWAAATRRCSIAATLAKFTSWAFDWRLVNALSIFAADAAALALDLDDLRSDLVLNLKQEAAGRPGPP